MTSPSLYQTASDVSLVIDGPSTPTKHRNFQLSVSGLRRLEKTLVSDPDHAIKLAGCATVVIGTVLEKFVGVDNLPALVGVLHASDGVATNPIHIDELCKGLLIHTDYSGEALPASQGGPLRIIFPKGIAVQSSVCGTPEANQPQRRRQDLSVARVHDRGRRARKSRSERPPPGFAST